MKSIGGTTEQFLGMIGEIVLKRRIIVFNALILQQRIKKGAPRIAPGALLFS
jgi:hypothetical protein